MILLLHVRRLIRGRVLALGVALAALSILTAPLNAAPDPTTALFQSTNVLRLRLEIAPADVEVLRAYEFQKGSNPESRTNVPATVRVGPRAWTNVAVHLKGSLGSFRAFDEKPALTLNFDKWADGQRFHGLQKISLNNSVQDATYVSETLCREMFAAAGLPSPRATVARLEVNDRDLGLYVLVEGWNRQFLKRHFKDTRGNLWDSGSAGDITADLDTNSGDDPWDTTPLDDLIDLAADTNLTHRLERLDRVLDVDRFLTFMAMEVMLAHWDGYCLNKNNYRVFHDRSTDKLIFLPHGMDQMFGWFRSTPTSTITPMMKGLVARAVIQPPEGRHRYLERLGQLATNVYDVARLTNRVHQLAARVQDALGSDPNARAQHQAAVNRLADRLALRGASVREQLATASRPLPFGLDHTVALTDWRLSRDSGSPSFTRRASPERTLEIYANGGRAYGSWRTQAFLNDGDYQFTGRIKLVDAAYSQSVTNGGATLRISGERTAKMLTAAADWTPFTYDFTIAGQLDVELVCEFRASTGRCLFDASSLKLIQKPRPGKN